MYCPKCGFTADIQAHFCPNCGFELEDDAPQNTGALPEGPLPTNALAADKNEDSEASAPIDMDVKSALVRKAAARNANASASASAASAAAPSSAATPGRTRTSQAPVGLKPVPRSSRSRVLQQRQQAEWEKAADLSNSKNAIRLGLGLAGVTFVAIVGIIAAVSINAAKNAPKADASAAQTTQAAQAATQSTTGAATDAATNDKMSVPSPKDDPSTYSFDELGQIAEKIETDATSRTEALELAQRYNLADAQGNLATATWTLTTTDGTSAPVRLVDIWHDGLASGGTAAFTFVTASPITTARMNATNTNQGGWEASELRAWLNNEFSKTLPAEVTSHVKAVLKATNNTGNGTDTSMVTTTEDAYWVPSVVELVGPVNWTWSSDKNKSQQYNAILNAEGSQYAAYSQAGVKTYGANQIFSSNQTLNLRSPSSSTTTHFRHVNESGNVARYGNPTNERGVLLGFCM